MSDLTEEEEKQIAEVIRRLNAVSRGESDLCIHCQQQFTELKQVGRCVYAYPCGHRQYQGTLPEKWKPKKKLHPYLQEQLDKEQSEGK